MTGLGRCLLLVFAMVLVLLCSSGVSRATNIEQTSIKEVDEQVAPRSKYITLPSSSLTRFLLYNARPIDRQANGLLGYKRSSSNLDALTGMTLGKRSMPMEYLNMEPYYGRHYGMRSVPRMYDLRWAPLDSYEAPVGSAELN